METDVGMLLDISGVGGFDNMNRINESRME